MVIWLDLKRWLVRWDPMYRGIARQSIRQEPCSVELSVDGPFPLGSRAVSCSAYLVIYFKRENFLNILWRFNSPKTLTKKRVSRSRRRWFVLKNVVATFKETSNLLQNILCWNLVIQLMVSWPCTSSSFHNQAI